MIGILIITALNVLLLCSGMIIFIVIVALNRKRTLNAIERNPILDAARMNGSNASTSAPATLITSSIPCTANGADSSRTIETWSNNNVNVLADGTSSSLGTLGTTFSRAATVAPPPCNSFFVRSAHAPLFWIATQPLAAVTVTVVMSVYVYSYVNTIDRMLDYNPKISVVKIIQGVMKPSSILSTHLYDSLTIPLTFPAFPRRIDINVTFPVVESGNPNTPITFDTGDVMALVFASEGTMSYTAYQGRVDVDVDVVV